MIGLNLYKKMKYDNTRFLPDSDGIQNSETSAHLIKSTVVHRFLGMYCVFFLNIYETLTEQPKAKEA